MTRSGFTGHEHDNDLGFIDMKGRVYDPLAARFTSADPIMQAPFWSQGLNRYSYAFNDPVNNVDPSGFDVAGDIVGGTVAAGHVISGGLIASGFGASFGSVASGAAIGLGSGANVAYKIATHGLAGEPRAGSTASGVAPTAAPSSTGSGQASATARLQNQPSVRPYRPRARRPHLIGVPRLPTPPPAPPPVTEGPPDFGPPATSPFVDQLWPGECGSCHPRHQNLREQSGMGSDASEDENTWRTQSEGHEGDLWLTESPRR